MCRWESGGQSGGEQGSLRQADGLGGAVTVLREWGELRLWWFKHGGEGLEGGHQAAGILAGFVAGILSVVVLGVVAALIVLQLVLHTEGFLLSVLGLVDDPSTLAATHPRLLQRRLLLLRLRLLQLRLLLLPSTLAATHPQLLQQRLLLLRLRLLQLRLLLLPSTLAATHPRLLQLRLLLLLTVGAQLTLR